MIAKLAYHPKESPIRTRVRVFGLHIFTAHQSGPWLTGRTPEDPLVQDSLTNPVLVLKKNNKWCMCIDYTSLNKACPKDPFALPRIDQVIESTAGCELLSFLDAYSRYHQIKLDLADRMNTAFITPFGAFCFLTMPFGLRNVGATFHRCMQKCLLKQLGRNAHIYVDNIVVKTKNHETLL